MASAAGLPCDIDPALCAALRQKKPGTFSLKYQIDPSPLVLLRTYRCAVFSVSRIWFGSFVACSCSFNVLLESKDNTELTSYSGVYSKCSK